MRSEEVDGAAERRVLAALATSREFLSRVVPKWERDMLRSRYANLVASWCVTHYRRYGTAPGRDVVSYFREWQTQTGDTDTAQIVNDFLVSLSDEYDRSEPVSVERLTDDAQALFNEVRVEKVREDSAKALRVGDLARAAEVVRGFREVSLRGTPGVDVFRDREARRRALEFRERELVKYPGGSGVGEFFAGELTENAFVAFAGIPKGMKSFTLFDIGYTAAMQKKRVAYFQIGDMTQEQIFERFITRVCGRPVVPKLCSWPTSLVVGDAGSAQVEREPRTFDSRLSPQRMDAAFDKLVGGMGDETYLKISCHPTGSISLAGVYDILKEWDDGGYNSQVVVVDYFENLAPIDRKAGEVQRVIDTWQLGRRISEERKCLLLTGHQTNKEGFSARVLTRKHFRGSLMVLATVTAFAGINQTDEEKDQQVFRLNWMVCRKKFYRETRCCTVAGALDFARPFVLSRY